ncbi:MAG: hypothetical protein B7Y80_08855 [Hyphomicrobium sp. 32-62-53]|nr:MAG: hypothetical protein B7Y80_08855 [Hyphomicrobium sp. 32-62-53]
MSVRVLRLRDVSNAVMNSTHRHYLARPAAPLVPRPGRGANAVHTPSSGPATKLDVLATLIKNQAPFRTTDALSIRSDGRRHNSDVA